MFNALPISFVTTDDDRSSKKLDQLNPIFMHTQIIKEIILTIQFEQQHIDEFIHYCREQFADNDHETNNINKIILMNAFYITRQIVPLEEWMSILLLK
jgi:hypothetical protein